MRALAQADVELLAKWNAVPKWAYGKPGKTLTAKQALTPAPTAPSAPAPAKRPPSRTTPGGSTALKPSPKYTGTKMLGIGVAHKSGLQPVFSKEQAEDLAKMRR